MIYSKPSIVFPEKQHSKMRSITFSRDEIQSLCNLQSFTVLAKGMANFAVQRSRTSEMKKQYAAMEEAVGIEYTEFESQAYIHFEELTKRLEIEFELKTKELEIELRKAEAEADRAFQKNKTEFNQYVKISGLYRHIFDKLRESANSIAEIIEYANKEEIALNTKSYIKFSEQYRVLIRGIEKYSQFIA